MKFRLLKSNFTTSNVTHTSVTMPHITMLHGQKGLQMNYNVNASK